MHDGQHTTEAKARRGMMLIYKAALNKEMIKMKQISRDAAKALMDHKKFKRDNTRVEIDSNGAAYLKLFGNTIACHEADGSLKITNDTWPTVTTKDRLNALPHVSIQQRQYVWYLNDKSWDGNWVIVYNPDPRGKQWLRIQLRSSDESEEA